MSLDVNALPGPSEALARFAAETRDDQVPPPVLHEAKRSLVNFFATALAGCDDPALRIANRVFERVRAAGACTVIGRAAPTDALHAASLNAMAGNVHDFDDTHLPTIIHPTAPVAPALFALAQAGVRAQMPGPEREGRAPPVSGRALLAALAIGIEVECRLGNAVSPWHYARGWHITATCGVFGAAAACGRLLGLDATRLAWALGHASAQSSGLVETLGSMSKSIGVGNAAANGLLSAWLAADGFEGPTAPLEGPRGFLRVMGEGADAASISARLGAPDAWALCSNTCKPYPCGVVLNPVIEAALHLHAEAGVRAAQVARVSLRGHPLLRQRTDRPRPASGREAQVSAQHAITVVLARGRAGLGEFSDAAVAEFAPARLVVDFADDASMGVESVVLTLVLRDGREITHRIEHARGSLQRPLSDAELDAKLDTLARFGASGCDAPRLRAALWALDSAVDAGAVMALAAGGHRSA